jgi:hypothetical protein
VCEERLVEGLVVPQGNTDERIAGCGMVSMIGSERVDRGVTQSNQLEVIALCWVGLLLKCR